MRSPSKVWIKQIEWIILASTRPFYEHIVTQTIEKHPKSLRIYFATEMWERYGFYVVQSLLALYLALHFQWPDKQVYALVGSFTALTYLSPLIGGWIADKLIGQKLAIFLGLLVLFISYGLLALLDSHTGPAPSLAGIAVGTGLLKPNISSLLGNEYSRGSKRRLSGFTIFYMGITSGIILGTTVPSQLGHYFGWGAAFNSAALGMVLAFIIFAFGVHYYKIQDYNPFSFQPLKVLLAGVLMSASWLISFFVLNYPALANLMFGLVVLLSALYILYSVYTEPSEQSRFTLVIGLLCLISVMFWAFYFEMFMSLTLFISRVVEPEFLGIPFPAPYYVTIQSLGMLLIGFYIARKQVPMSVVARGLDTGKKFLISMAMMTLAYLSIVLASRFTSPDALISPALIIPAYLMISVAELLLSPVGLSAITMLSSKDKVSTMMGIFFVSLGIGGFLSGKLSNLGAVPDGETNLLVLKKLYITAFTTQLGILFGATLCCLIIFAVIKFLLEDRGVNGLKNETSQI